MNQNCTPSDIAVIGMAGRFPGAASISEYWDNILNGRETIKHFTSKELIQAGIDPAEVKKPNYIKAKGILNAVEEFDASFFGLPPSEAELMDPQIRILLETVWEAFENAGCNPETFKGSIGSFFGANDNYYWLKMLNAQSKSETNGYDGFTLNLRDYIATRISYSLNLKGPSLTSLTACSTSLVTIHQACVSLKNGECNMAVAGGVSLTYPFISGYLYQEGLMISPDGHCHTFDESANGTVFSDGVGVVVLKPLLSALKDKDYIYAVIKGSAINNDGNEKLSYTSPGVNGQISVILKALDSSGFQPADITYIETHGTATKTGDPVEVEALRRAYGSVTGKSFYLGSVKPNIGHTNVASGVASFIKTVLILENRIVPPQISFSKLNSKLDTPDNPFIITTVPVKIVNNAPMRAGVSAFGFGGTNAHVIVEEFQKNTNTQPVEVNEYPVLLSARTPAILDKKAKQFTDYLHKNKKLNLADVSFTLCTGRKPFAYRYAFMSRTMTEISDKLKTFAAHTKVDYKKRPLAFMFPGQGSQFPTMGKSLYQTEAAFRKTVDYCSACLKPLLNVDLRDILFPEEKNIKESEQALKQTAITQPSVFVISYALSKLYEEYGITPAYITGHSIGEYAGACVSGVFSLEDTLYLVAERGRLIQQLPGGSMLSVHMPAEMVHTLPVKNISLAAVNAPQMIVLSGETKDIEKVRTFLHEKKIANTLLYTSHAFHSNIMDELHDRFINLFKNIPLRKPLIPIISTVTGGQISDEEIMNPDYWFKNLRETVQFDDAVQFLYSKDALLLECGPGTALSTLARSVAQHKSTGILFSPIALNSKNGGFYDRLCSLWSHGQSVTWENYFNGKNCSRIPLPSYPFDNQKFSLKNSDPGVHNKKNSQTSLVKNHDQDNWFYCQTWKRSLPPAEIIKTGNTWLIFAGTDSLSLTLIDKLKEQNEKIVVVNNGEHFKEQSKEAFFINVSEIDDYHNLFKKLIATDRKPGKIIYLWSLNTGEPNGNLNVNGNTEFFSLLYLAQVLGKNNITERIDIYVVTNSLYKVTGTELQSNIGKAGIIGPVKVIPQEFPNVNCVNIDIDLNESSINNVSLDDILVRELYGEYSEPIIAYRNGYKWVQHFEKLGIVKSTKNKKYLKKGGVYLITGGLGGIGLALAGFIAAQYPVKLILTGRSEFPAKELWKDWLNQNDENNPVSKKIQKLLQIEKNGTEIHIISADVTNRLQMIDLIKLVCNKTGNLNGIIHAAGLPGEGIIQLKEKDRVEIILGPKMEGTLVMNELCSLYKPDFLVLCSSIASVLGGIGLVDYCSANNFMDLYASCYGMNNGCKIISINWDMWGETGMGLKTYIPRELKEWFDNELKNGITSEEGIEIFDRILKQDNISNVIVSTRDLYDRINLWIKREFLKERKSSIENNRNRIKYNRPELSVQYDNPCNVTEKKIAAIWENLFAIDRIGRNDNFYEIGGHSLLATILANELQNEFGMNISIQHIMDHPTVMELAGLLNKKR